MESVQDILNYKERLLDEERMKATKEQIIEEMLLNPVSVIKTLKLTLYEFLKVFWNEVSEDEFKDNWHIKYLCDELQLLAERVAENKPKLYDLIINVPPGTSKPVWEEMPILMWDGSYRKLKHIRVGNRVINRFGNATEVKAVHIQGLQPSLKITTMSGRKLYTAIDHPILTTKGWKNAEDIIIGDYVALLHKQNIEKDTSERTIDEFKLAGYFIGDGSVSHGNCFICGKDLDYLADFIKSAVNLGFDYRISRDKRNGLEKVNLKSKIPINKESQIGKFKGMGRGFREDTKGPRYWLREIGLSGDTSKTKRVPSFVFNGSEEKISAFLSAYFHCDGTVSYKHESKRNIVVSATTISKGLAYDLQKLFLRMGVSMKVRKRIQKNGYAYNPDLKDYVYYTIETTDQDTAAIFLEKIDITGRKLNKLKDFNPQRRTFDQTYWPDEVVDIEKVQDLPCRCLTVEDGASFVVDGIVVHNTTIVSIMFPVWCWTRWYHFKFITASHTEKLALESAEKSRNIINSDKFKALYPDLIINEDKQVKGNYQIIKKEYVNPERARLYRGGTRLSTSVGSKITGFHAHIIIVDDPIDPKGAASDVKINDANKYMDETLSMRKVDKEITPTVLIMQRLHQDDPSGHILEKADKKIRHICLPAEIVNYKEKVQPPELTKYYVNNLLDPVRLGFEALKQIEVDLGEYAYAGQMGQSPTPPGGALFKVDNFQIIQSLPSDIHVIKKIRYWDKAASKNKGKRTAGVKMFRLKNNKVIIVDVRMGQWAVEDRERIIRQTAEADGQDVEVWVEQEPGSGGKESADATIKNLFGYVCYADRPQDDKETRALPYAVQVNNGNVWLLQGDWNKPFIEEHRYFPFGKFKDQVDAAAGAFNKLAAKRMARMLT